MSLPYTTRASELVRYPDEKNRSTVRVNMFDRRGSRRPHTDIDLRFISGLYD